VTHAACAPGDTDHPGIQAAAARALALIPDGARIGLGSGRAASAFITMLGARVKEGLRIWGVPTSREAGELARRSGVSLIELGADVALDFTVDGADEVAPNLDLIKGRGGALVRERIVAASSASQLILVGAEKLVQALGERGPLPVEVTPLAAWLVSRACASLGLTPARRMQAHGEQPFITDNGNEIIDCLLPVPLPDGDAARALERQLRGIVGVIDTGLFLGTADRVLVGHPDGRVDILTRTGR
jgi:ribose 5-phosphate isomerase A